MSVDLSPDVEEALKTAIASFQQGISERKEQIRELEDQVLELQKNIRWSERLLGVPLPKYERKGLGVGQEILEYLRYRAEPLRLREIADGVGHPSKLVSPNLTRLRTQGKVVRIAHGTWELA